MWLDSIWKHSHCRTSGLCEASVAQWAVPLSQHLWPDTGSKKGSKKDRSDMRTRANRTMCRPFELPKRAEVLSCDLNRPNLSRDLFESCRACLEPCLTVAAADAAATGTARVAVGMVTATGRGAWCRRPSPAVAVVAVEAATWAHWP